MGGSGLRSVGNRVREFETIYHDIDSDPILIFEDAKKV
jgi:hypothetical protein